MDNTKEILTLAVEIGDAVRSRNLPGGRFCDTHIGSFWSG